MSLAPSPALDAAEDLADLVCRQLGVCTLSISAYDRRRGELRTLVNAGVLGPGEERRPAQECYPLRSFPAAAALVHDRRPYVISPTVPGDRASHALAAALRKTSQAAAPIVVDGELWGELWVGSSEHGLPLTLGELPLVVWAAERTARVMRDLIEDTPPGTLPEGLGGRLRPYEISVDGRVGSLVGSLLPGSARHERDFTVVTAAIEARDVLTLLLKLHAFQLSVAAVRIARHGRPGAPPVPARRDAAQHIYELEVAGAIDTAELRATGRCSVAHARDTTRLTAMLDREGLAGMFRLLDRMRAELLGLRRFA